MPQSTSTLDPMMLSYLDPEMGEQDPRARLMQSLMAMKMPMGPSIMPQHDSSVLSNPSTMDDITPPDFDKSTGMPTTFPATERKNQAADKLKRVSSDPMGSTKDKLIRAAIAVGGTLAAGALGNGYSAAGAAQGSLQGANTTYERGMNERGIAQHQYEFEAGQEEKQRETALRERLGLAQIESTRAYRNLLIEMRRRAQDVQTRGQNIGARKAGFDVTDNPSSSTNPNLEPVGDSDLSALQQQQNSLNQAKEEYTRAQTEAIPEKIAIARQALQKQMRMLEVTLANLRLRESEHDINYYGVDPMNDMQPPPGQPTIDGNPVGTRTYGAIHPSTTAQSRGEQSQVISEAGQNLIGVIKQHANELGPVMGRYNSLRDLLGNPPPEYAGTAAQLISFIALQPAAHGFRGLKAVEEFEKAIGKPIRTPEALIAAIQGTTSGLTALQDVGLRKHTATTPNLGSKKLKKGGGPASPPSSTGAGGPPPGAKIVQWQDFVK